MDVNRDKVEEVIVEVYEAAMAELDAGRGGAPRFVAVARTIGRTEFEAFLIDVEIWRRIRIGDLKVTAR